MEQPIVILRDGKRVTLSVACGEQPDNGKFANGPTATLKELGLDVSELTEDAAKRLALPAAEGVMITSVHAGSAADRMGLTDGMVIVEANRQPVATVADLQAAVSAENATEGILLLVRSSQGTRYVVVGSPS